MGPQQLMWSNQTANAASVIALAVIVEQRRRINNCSCGDSRRVQNQFAPAETATVFNQWHVPYRDVFTVFDEDVRRLESIRGGRVVANGRDGNLEQGPDV